MNFRMLLIITLIPAVAAVISFLSFFTPAKFSEDFLKLEQKSLEQIAHKTVLELDMWLDERTHEIDILSKIDLFKDACAGKRVKEAGTKLEIFRKSSPMYDNIFLTDTVTGKVILDAVGGKTVGYALSKSPTGVPNFEAALKGKIHISEAIVSPVDGSPVILFTSPIYSKGNIVGMIGEAIKLNYFSEIFIDSYKVGEAGYIYMVDSKGNMLAHPEKETIMKMNLGDYDFGKKIMNKKKGTLAYDEDGRKRFTAFDSSARSGWIVNVGISVDELRAPIEHIRNISYVFGGVLILIFSGIIWAVSAYLFKIINRSVKDLKEGSGQIMTAAGEMSANSQSLAEGASEQAASTEETSSSLEEMAAMTRQNADNADNADKEMKRALVMLKEVGNAVSDLTDAMGEIHASGEESSRIISTINSIAFQTNLLSLNAAVEAARAGETGAGFAVVAEEVRNLAMKTAEAAENTSAIIQETGKKITGGVERLSKANQTFDQLKKSIQSSAERLSDISDASDEQARGIDQVTEAVGQMDQVVQKNAANAEESASASYEMNAQIEKIIGSIGHLVKLVQGNRQSSSS